MNIYELNGDVIGLVDMQVVRRNLNDLKPVTVEIARILLRSALDVIEDAKRIAKQPWYKADLPRQTARDNVYWKLIWHRDNLAGLAAADPVSAYAAGGDLKKWAAEAFIEHNAAEEGSAYLDAAWSRMWNDIREGLAHIPKAALAAASGAVLSVTGLPIWAWALIAVGGTGAIVGISYGIKRAVSRR